MSIDPGNIKTVAVDLGQHGIGPTINPGYRVAGVHRALADKRPWPELIREIGTSPPGRETGYAGKGTGSEGKHMHGDLDNQRMRRVPRRVV